MKVSCAWLGEIVPGLEAAPEELAEHLASRGAPVESVVRPGEGLADVVVARVIEVAPHPNADRLSLCTVDGGAGELRVVCGAPNVRAGGFYPFAPVGAALPGGLRVRRAKIRGEASEGMLCSARELGLGADHAGILELAGEHAPGEPLASALGLDDAVLDVEVTSNRGDLLCHLGVARELAPLGGGSVRLPALPGDPGLAPAYEEARAEVSAAGSGVRIEEPELCPRYLAALVRGVRVGPSPAWLRNRLRAVGARPINNVVDATNYVMLEVGQPLHAFDLSRLEERRIVVRRPGPGERALTTLDGEERALGPENLLICDGRRPVAVAGVMGGRDSEVGDATTDVLLECALFEPRAVRASRRALDMSTDASYRFERGVDPEGLRRAVERAAALIVATAGGHLEGPVLDVDARPFQRAVVPLRLERVARVLGVPFTRGRVRELLDPLGFEVSGPDGADRLDVRVPGFRSRDVTREVDLVEEIARTHGFDAFPEVLGPYRPNTVPDDPRFGLEDALRRRLAARGFLEAHTPAFVGRGEGDVEVSNPLNAREPFLRATLVPSLLRRVEYNLARGNRDVRLFEIGTSFRSRGAGELPNEEAHLAVVATGRRDPPHWSVPDRAFDVWDLKALLAEVAAGAYRDRLDVVAAGREIGPFDEARSFAVRGAGGGEVGWGGAVRDGVLDRPAWASDVWAIELALPAEVPPEPVPVYRPLPQHPAVERDLALLVPDEVAARDVLRRIETAAGPLFEALDVFDVYRGEGVDEGVRSVAVRLRFRAPDRTLKDEEVDGAVGSVLEALKEELGVGRRG